MTADTDGATMAELAAAYAVKFRPMFATWITPAEFSQACDVDAPGLWDVPVAPTAARAGRPPMPRPTAATITMDIPAYNDHRVAHTRLGYTGWNVKMNGGSTVRLAGWLVVMGEALYAHYAKRIALPPEIVAARKEQRVRMARNLHRQGLRRKKKAPKREQKPDPVTDENRVEIDPETLKRDLAALSRIAGQGSPTSPGALLQLPPSPLRPKVAA